MISFQFTQIQVYLETSLMEMCNPDYNENLLKVASLTFSFQPADCFISHPRLFTLHLFFYFTYLIVLYNSHTTCMQRQRNCN